MDAICRYYPSGVDSKKNNCQIHVMIFEHGTPEDMLLWYSKIQDTMLKTSYINAGTKFNIAELLPTGQAKRNVLQFKKNIMSKDPENGLGVNSFHNLKPIVSRSVKKVILNCVPFGNFYLILLGYISNLPHNIFVTKDIIIL